MTVHFFLQFKGGIGTTLAASLLTNYLQNSGQRVCYIDLDPICETSLSCQPFLTETVNIVDDSMTKIDRSNFDDIVEKSIEHEGPIVVDVCSTVAIPFLTYMNEKAAAAAFKSLGKKVIFHAILAGGRAMEHTVRGIHILLGCQLVPVVVWENAYFGEVVKNGKTFFQSELFGKNHLQIMGVIKLDNNDSRTPFDIQEQIFNKLAHLSL